MSLRLVDLVKANFQLPENNIPLWDGWRGLAIVFVLLGHFGNTEMIKEDRLGVDIFFVLSGMLMARLLFEKRTDLKTFYVRRFSRIFPALLVFVSYMFFIALVTGQSFLAIEFFTNLTFIRTYIPSDPHIWTSNIPVKNLWSLNVEEHAYIIMSVLTLVLFKVRHIAFVLIFMGILSVSISIYYNATQIYSETFFLLRTESAINFIMISAGYRLYLHKRTIEVSPWLPLITLLLAASCYLSALPLWVSFVFPPFLLAFSVNHLSETPAFFHKFLSNRILRLLGLWSYSIYLWQQPLFEYKWVIPGPDFAIPLCIALLAGICSHTFIEAPARHSINNWWEQRKKYPSKLDI